MKAIIINQKVTLIRHWFKWYNVQRGGEDWRPLKISRYVKEKSIGQIAADLKKKYPGGSSLPTILDEKAADAEVEKNLPKNRAQKKGRG